MSDEEAAAAAPDFIACTAEQAQAIIVFGDKMYSAQREFQGVLYQAAVQLEIDLKAYEFNFQAGGFVRKPCLP